MAKIQYIAPSPKAGQIEHVRPDTARTLVAAGFAIDIPYKDFRARLADAGAANDPHNVNHASKASSGASKTPMNQGSASLQSSSASGLKRLGIPHRRKMHLKVSSADTVI
jgi:hypothetical protein